MWRKLVRFEDLLVWIDLEDFSKADIRVLEEDGKSRPMTKDDGCFMDVLSSGKVVGDELLEGYTL